VATTETKIKITADASSAEREIDKLSMALNGLDKTTNAVGKALAVLTAAAGAATAALVVAFDRLDNLGDAADAIGIGVNELKALEKAAAAAGVSADQVEAGFKRLGNNLTTAFMDGGSAAARSLALVGLNARDLLNLPVDQQMTKIAEAISKIESPAIRSAVAMDLLGKGGDRLVQAFKDPAAIEAFKQRLEGLGLAISQADLDNVNKLEKEVGNLKATWNAFLEKTVAALAPYITDLIKRINDAIDASGGFENILLEIIDTVEAIAKAVAILAAVYVGGKLVRAANDAASAVSGILLAFIPGAGVAARIIKLVGGIVGLTAAVATGKVTKDAIDVMGNEFDTLRKSIKDTRAERQTPQPATNGGGAADAERLLGIAIGQTTEDYLKRYNLQTDMLGLTKQETEERKIAQDIAEKAKTTTEAVMAAQGNLIKQAAEQRINKEIEVSITNQLKDLDTERLGLSIMDKNEREVALAIRKMERDYGRQLTDREKERLSIALKATQAERERFGVAQAIYDYTRKQTEVEKINRAISLQGTLDPTGTAKKEYQKDQDALQTALDNKLINEQQYYDQRAKLAENYQMKIMSLESQEFQNFNQLNDMKIQREAERYAASLRGQQDVFGNQMFNEQQIQQIAKDRAEFEKKTEMQKGQFILEQGAAVFSALGAQNKKAFEAAKAFNIANALMNTYMAATKALATYPWPFGLVAAAAAVAGGLAQVAQIRSQSYSGRALGGPVMGGKPYLVGESGPELFTPNTTGSITRNQDLGGGGNVNVNFQIIANDTSGFDQLLVSRKGVIQQIISDAMLEKGRRSMV
jgi:hypothetical protein